MSLEWEQTNIDARDPGALGNWWRERSGGSSSTTTPMSSRFGPVQIVRPGSPSPIVYSVTVTNIGDRPANFAMQGGGNV